MPSPRLRELQVRVRRFRFWKEVALAVLAATIMLVAAFAFFPGPENGVLGATGSPSLGSGGATEELTATPSTELTPPVSDDAVGPLAIPSPSALESPTATPSPVVTPRITPHRTPRATPRRTPTPRPITPPPTAAPTATPLLPSPSLPIDTPLPSPTLASLPPASVPLGSLIPRP